MRSQADYTNIIIGPAVTEKSHRSAEKNKTIVLKVLPKASKPQIREAVEKLFEVKVAAIRTVKIKGKVKNFAGRPTQRSDSKKAYITLKEGFDINFAGQ